MSKLTDVECRNATCPTGINPKTHKPYGVRKLADGGGLFLWVAADGSKRWRYRYFVEKEGRKVEKLISLGVYPAVSLAEARVEAAKAALIGDPGAARKAVKVAKAKAAENTFEALALQWHKNHSAHWSPKYAEAVLRRMKADLFPALGSRPVADIEATEVIATLLPIQARGNKALAFRVLGHITNVLDYAINTGVLRYNVAQGREGALAPAPRRNHPHVEPEELSDLLKCIDQYQGDRRTQLALKMLPMVFTRVNELLQATWAEFDMDNALWEIPAARMKKRRPHLVPLAPQALAVLAELKELNGSSRWVFPGRSFDKPLASKTLLTALGVMGYGGKMTSHGFRHVASTALNEARDGDDMLFDESAIEAQLAHVQGGVRGVYNKARYLPERRRIMGWWADYLDSLT